MSDNIIDECLSVDELSKNARSGTELMKEKLFKYVDNDLLSNFFVIPSRVRDIHPIKHNLLWLHDMWNDPENRHLMDAGSLSRFAKLVFVSHYQKNMYGLAFNLKPSKVAVMHNAIDPIDMTGVEKPKDVINLVYHTTPHRGLEILYPVFNRLSGYFGNRIHLHVFSSFNLYGWPERDEPYKDLFNELKNHPNITYYGSVTNEEVRDALKNMHVFSYPCLPFDSRIVTENGIKTIGWIVKQKYAGKVLSLDKCGKFVWSSVKNWSVRRNEDKKWIKINGKTRRSRRRLICTEDHPCAYLSDILLFDSFDYLPARDIVGKWIVKNTNHMENGKASDNAFFNNEQISALLGILMGDGNISKRYVFQNTQGIDQESYLLHKQSILGGRILRIKPYKSSFSRREKRRLILSQNPQLKYIRDLVYPDGKKTVKNILNYMNEISLAFWFMDDGNSIVPNKKRGEISFKAQLCTYAFPMDDIDLLIRWFKTKFDIDAYYYNGAIKFNSTNAKKLFTIIAPYIPVCMEEYVKIDSTTPEGRKIIKLPVEFRNIQKKTVDNNKLEISAEYVDNISYVSDNDWHSRSKLYDIEVGDTHNFIANGFVVHNCIWTEQSCIASIEAMSAKNIIVCPDLGALPETCGKFAQMYRFHEDPVHHAVVFEKYLYSTILHCLNEGSDDSLLEYAKNDTDILYGWNYRAKQWEILLNDILQEVNK